MCFRALLHGRNLPFAVDLLSAFRAEAILGTKRVSALRAEPCGLRRLVRYSSPSPQQYGSDRGEHYAEHCRKQIGEQIDSTRHGGIARRGIRYVR